MAKSQYQIAWEAGMRENRDLARERNALRQALADAQAEIQRLQAELADEILRPIDPPIKAMLNQLRADLAAERRKVDRLIDTFARTVTQWAIEAEIRELRSGNIQEVTDCLKNGGGKPQ